MLKKITLFFYLSIFVLSTSYAKDYRNYSISPIIGFPMGIKATARIDKSFSISTSFHKFNLEKDGVKVDRNQVFLTGNVHPLAAAFYVSGGLTYTKANITIPSDRVNVNVKPFGGVFLLGYNSSAKIDNITFLDFSIGAQYINCDGSFDGKKIEGYLEPILLFGLGVAI